VLAGWQTPVAAENEIFADHRSNGPDKNQAAIAP
jgi:hypothetical protein